MAHKENGKVLLVEDEALIRLIAVDALESLGHQVIEAENATDALAVLAAHDDIAILFTDINMPGAMDGLALAKQVSLSRPEIRVIITSGKQWLDRSRLPCAGTFLPKPYLPSDLAALMPR